MIKTQTLNMILKIEFPSFKIRELITIKYPHKKNKKNHNKLLPILILDLFYKVTFLVFYKI